MRFLLDTDNCSNHLGRPGGLTHRFIQHARRSFIPTFVLGELHVRAHQRADPFPLLRSIDDDLLDRPCAEESGRVRGRMLREGVTVGRLDLMIASVALAHDLAVVTHNTEHFALIPDLRLVDWLT